MMIEAVLIEAVMPVEASMANGSATVTTAEARSACAARFARQTDCQYDRQHADRDERQLSRWVANIYLRHPYVCAQGAALIGDATEGRFILGLIIP
jgi:hypothetical protein